MSTTWQQAPTEPTQEMVRAAFREQPGAINAGFAQAYCTMMVAAPKPPVTNLSPEGLRQIRERMFARYKGAASYEGGWAISTAALMEFINDIDNLLKETPQQDLKGNPVVYDRNNATGAFTDPGNFKKE